MIVNLPSDLLHAIVDTLSSRATILVLCRVSKSFHCAFTPYLYRQIRLGDQKLLKSVLTLQAVSHLRFTKELFVEIDDDGSTSDGLEAAAAAQLDTCLKKMTELVALRILNRVGGNGFCGSQHGSALEELARQGTLLDLSLGGQRRGLLLESLPVFANLRRLSLHYMTTCSVDPRRHRDLAETLSASPHLRHLGLSLGDNVVDLQFELYYLTMAFRDRCVERGTSVLRLEELDLGHGYLPAEFDSDAGYSSNYLSQLTNLQSLRSLKLANDPKEDPPISATLLKYATNLAHLDILHFGQEVLDLIADLHRKNPGVLNSISFISLRWPIGDRDRFVNPIPYLKHNWRRVSFHPTTRRQGWDCLTDFVQHCKALEYLSCPPNEYVMAVLRDYMPHWKHLHTLVFNNAYYPNAKKPCRRGKIVKDREMRDLAIGPFLDSWEAYEARSEADKGTRLQYVGVWKRMWTAIPVDLEKIWSPCQYMFETKLLSEDEARAFMESPRRVREEVDVLVAESPL